MFSQIVALAFAALIAPAAASVSGCTRTYTVKEGDFCDLISAAQNSSTYQLYAVNAPTINAECSNLMPNQTLCLGTTGADCTTTYVVKADDTCDSIASATGVNTTMLNHNNPQITDSCDNIYTGEVLCIAPKVLRPSAPASSGASSTAAPVPTTPATATAPASSSSASAKSGSGALSGGDDDNLPYCDEL